jgi:hypothetical protein
MSPDVDSGNYHQGFWQKWFYEKHTYVGSSIYKDVTFNPGRCVNVNVSNKDHNVSLPGGGEITPNFKDGTVAFSTPKIYDQENPNAYSYNKVTIKTGTESVTITIHRRQGIVELDDPRIQIQTVWDATVTQHTIHGSGPLLVLGGAGAVVAIATLAPAAVPVLGVAGAAALAP